MAKVPTIEEIFNGLNMDTLEMVDDFYHATAEFIDPIVHLKTPPEIRRYYKNLYQNLISIRFDFSKHIVSGADHVVFWTMYLKHKKIKRGKEVTLIGNSHIIMDPKTSKALYHRDYYDMGEFIYEQIPLLGSLIKGIKRLLKPF